MSSSTYKRGGYRRPIPVLPDPETLPFPNNLIRQCSKCSLRAGCKAPVPGDGLIPSDLMFVGQNPGCFPAGTYISSPDGVKDIADIIVGDFVLGASGQTQRVTRVFQRETDRLVNIKVRKNVSISATPNHPFLVIRPKECAYQHERRYCFPCYKRDSCPHRAYDSYVPEWMSASQLSMGDHVVIPGGMQSVDLARVNITSQGTGILRVPFPQLGLFRRTKAKWHGRQPYFRLACGLAYVLGWYMAEGTSSVKNGAVSFCLGNKDGSYRHLLEEQCFRAFGFKGRWHIKGTNYTYNLYSRPLAAWFLDLFGSNSHNKRIPAPIFHSDRRIIKSFVTGWYRGDGRHKKRPNNDGIVTASAAAAFGLRDLLIRIGLVPTLHKEIWSGYAGSNPASGSGFVVEFPISFTWRRDTAAIPFGGNRLLCVDAVTPLNQPARVYNIETEDNTYLLPFIVHNSNEDEYGRPFIGQSGQYLDSLLFQSGISRSNCYITNLVKCKTPNNRELHQPEIAACSPWLDLELASVQPRIIVAMGKPAILHFLGSTAGTLTVEHLHGKPVEQDGYIILPCYHPAAALRDTGTMRHVQEDFNVLRGLVKGTPPSSYIVKDDFPNPDYRIADTPARLKTALDEIRSADEFAIDLETTHRDTKLWSIQVSTHPGSAWFIPIPSDFSGRFDLRSWGALAIIHNYLHDILFLDIADDSFVDSMVMAYLCGLPQGLKELAYRLCGAKMITYKEMIHPAQRPLSIKYLTKAASRDWPDPPPITETKWDNKLGKIVTRNKKPWHISRKIKNILDDCNDNPETDPFDRWNGYSVEERSCVEKSLGLMPEASLADIPLDEAAHYSCKDSDLTFRVKQKLAGYLENLGLNFILAMDTDILPMVHNMMDNGMAVDLDYYRKLSDDYSVRMADRATVLADMVGHAFNPASSQQVANVIYGELGFTPTAFTPTKEISTDDQELKKVKHPAVKEILKYRGLLKLKSTYADAAIELARLDEHSIPRLHTIIKTTRVETGRLSSSQVNLQNIPTRNKEGRAVKNGFVAPPGKVLLECDYSQIEMRTLAHLSNCKRLVDLFNRDGDPHTEMAAHIFGVPLDIAKQEKYRYPVKRLNFGVAYLIGARGLADQIQEYIADLELEGEKVEIEPWTEQICQKFLADWYRLNPEVRDFQMEMAAMARRYGFVRDIFGRMRYIPEVSCPIKSIQEAGLRQAANQPVTASAQGIIKLAMGQLWKELPHTMWRNDVIWCMQIHDSLVVQVTEDDEILKPFASWMLRIMARSVSLRVPVKVDAKSGGRWGDLQKLKVDY